MRRGDVCPWSARRSGSDVSVSRERREVWLGLERCGLARPSEQRREVTWVEPC